MPDRKPFSVEQAERRARAEGYPGSFTHPTIGRIGFEFAMPTRHSDAYIIAFEPDHEDYPDRVEADDAPDEWHAMADNQMHAEIANARAEGW